MKRRAFRSGLTCFTPMALLALPADGRAQQEVEARAAAFQTAADDLIEGALKRLPVPGLAMSVVVGDGIVFARGFGVADIENGVTATAETDFYIASSTKSFTALAAALLAARGELDLDASLADYFPDVAFDPAVGADRITLRDLLAHTSGLDNDAIVFRAAFTGASGHEDLVGVLASTRPNERAPHGTFQYTNLGYNIASLILDDVTGKPWQDVLRDEVFAPAGLGRTTAYASLPVREGWPVAAPYTAFGEEGLEQIYLEKRDNTMQAAGGMYSTAADLGCWLVLQINDGRIGDRQIFPAAVIRDTQRPVAQTDADFGPFRRHGGYGLGWYIGEYGDDTLIHHFGGFAGFRAHVSFMPAHDIGVAVVVNEASVGGRLADMLAAWAYDWWLGPPGAETDGEARVAEIASWTEANRARIAEGRASRAERRWQLTEPLEAYTGAYASGDFGTAVVTIEAGTLAVRMGNLYAVSTPYTETNTIRVELIPGRGQVFGFEVADDGRVTGARFADALFERVE